MSIQTELTRIINAKAAIKTAIEGKGVTVPDGTLLDGMAALIESIEIGGGGVELQYNRLYPASTGTFTPAARTAVDTSSPIIIEHNAGIVPFVVLITSNGMNEINDLDFIVSWRIPHYNNKYYNLTRLYSVSSKKDSSSTGKITSYGPDYNNNYNWDTKNFNVAQVRSTFYVNAGKTYTWTVYGIE